MLQRNIGVEIHVELDQNWRMIFVADHASRHIPDHVALGVPDEALHTHIAWDIGVDDLARRMAAACGAPVHLGHVSRLLIDLNREQDAPGLIPEHSDGVVIPGNHGLSDADRRARIDQYWRPYHDALAGLIDAARPGLLVSIHSFTPQLATRPEEQRPWEIGVLYNEDDRAARIAIPQLEAAGLITGDQLPYSGKLLNATMNRHGEGNGIPYLGLEVRQDLLADAAGVARMAGLLLPVIQHCRARLG
jgi:predicted N-formylglutamate amidohydrolase